MSSITPPLDCDAVFQWAKDLYANAVDQKDAAGFAAVFSESASLRFGNNPPIIGRREIETAIAFFFTTFVSLSHQSAGRWLDENTLVLEAVVTYTRHDGGVVTIPAVTIFKLSGSIAQECRIYVDLAPLYAST